MQLVFSSERRDDIRAQMGAAHYSYRFVEEAFRQAFERDGHRVVDAKLPEIFKQTESCSALLGAPASDIVHLAFRSTENLRPIPGAINIAHFAWEFDVMKDHGLPWEPATSDQVHMLGVMDAVWVQCEFTRQVLERHGLLDVRTVPAPCVDRAGTTRLDRDEAVRLLTGIPCLPLVLSSGLSRQDDASLAAEHMTALQPILREAVHGGRKIFLMMCNPHDLRKNLLNTIEAFQLATGGEDHLFVIKLIVSNTGNFQPFAIHDHLVWLYDGPGCVFSDRIQIVSDFLSDDQMTALYSVADYFVSTSHCEGFNLPLIEAMAVGIVPVATRNTAMLDYVDEGNAIVVPETRWAGLIRGMAGDVSGRTYALSSATRFDIARAMKAALSLSPAEYGRLSRAAQDSVAVRYSARAVMPTVHRELERLTARSVARVA